MSDLSFESLSRKFDDRDPSPTNALEIYAGSWKFDFDRVGFTELYDAIMRDPRPQWCAETFPDFHRLRIAELGSADGYNTAGLEYRGASQLTAIEGNADSFMRCLILKNHLSLQAHFMLGDFTRHFARPDVSYDLVYASGVLYHLPDPLRFLHDLSSRTRHLYLWTHVYDAQCVDLIETERHAFAEGRVETASLAGFTARYFHRRYDLQHVASVAYIGGLGQTSVWLTREDLFGALDAYGFDVLKTIDDPYREGTGMMPAVNILATRRDASV